MKIIEQEIWKTIEGFENYEISNLGRLKNNKGHFKKQLINDAGGYKYSMLYSNGKSKFFSIHRLVALAFISNDKNLPEVNHKNFDPEDNRVENLEWCTHRDNLHYSKKAGRYKIKDKKGEENPRSKLTNEQVLKIREACSKNLISQCELGRMYGVSQMTISRINKRKLWSHI